MQIFHKIKYDLRGHSRSQIMTFWSKIRFFFCLCYWLIEETNASEHYERTKFDLYKDDICLVLTLAYVLIDNFCPCFFGYLALGESRQDFVNIVCIPALIQTFITLFFYCKITSVNSLHENKFCRWICTQKRVLNVCFKDFWYTTNYSILFISFEIKKTHKNILFGHKESYTLI